MQRAYGRRKKTGQEKAGHVDKEQKRERARSSAVHKLSRSVSSQAGLKDGLAWRTSSPNTHVTVSRLCESRRWQAQWWQGRRDDSRSTIFLIPPQIWDARARRGQSSSVSTFAPIPAPRPRPEPALRELSEIPAVETI